MDIPVYSFVAYSNTGKTTFLEKLVPVLKEKGLRTAVLKHDSHEFEVDMPGKDTWRMTRAGAEVTAICSSSHAAIMENRQTEPERLLEKITDVDVILTEGCKHGPWKKIGLVRAANGKPLPEIEGEYFAVISDMPLDMNVPVFSFDDPQGLARLIYDDMRATKHGNIRELRRFERLFDSKWRVGEEDSGRSWDARSDDWDRKYRDGSDRGRESSKRVTDTVDFLLARGLIKNDFAVADVGCGPGRYAALFADHAKSVVGIDVSEKMTDYARRYAEETGRKNVSFVTGEFHDMDIKGMGLERRFDLAFSSLTPAVGGVGGLNNFIALSRQWCCNICFVRFENELNDSVLKDVFSRSPRRDKTTHSQWFWEMFNVLYLRGYEPEVTYVDQTRRTMQSADLDTARYLAWYLLPPEDRTTRNEEKILSYLKERADTDGFVTEDSFCKYARTVWNVASSAGRK
ncbi:MAG: molybdopterin-guanine dinucleotide biosynthesis protein B [Oscillospiraceae bacterium]|nr:molybdopterin-guanine dinucleotide biosynthesis protein B [Oscillospiraceae bacterium]